MGTRTETTEKPSTRLLSHREVQERVCFSDSHIQRLIKAGRFPPAIKLGLGKFARLAWPEHEIEEWIADRMAERSGGEAA